MSDSVSLPCTNAGRLSDRAVLNALQWRLAEGESEAARNELWRLLEGCLLCGSLECAKRSALARWLNDDGPMFCDHCYSGLAAAA